MKKILIASLIAFVLVSTGSAVAWNIDIFANVTDADVDITAAAGALTEDGFFAFGTTAGVDGSGIIDIWGHEIYFDDLNRGYLQTSVGGEGELYATQSQLVVGCCIDCAEGPCNECPDYLYTATSGASIDGNGGIFLVQKAHSIWPVGNQNDQMLMASGEGDFTAGMMSTLAVEGEEPVSHAMGAAGANVGFTAFGYQGMDADDCGEGGFFTASMWFFDEGCDPDCDECPPCK